MLQGCDKTVIKYLEGSRIVIFTDPETTCDVPELRYLNDSKCFDGRDYKDTVGLGGVRGNPVTTIKESNLLRNKNNKGYVSESILVHEFGHHIMNIGISNELKEEVKKCYLEAKNNKHHVQDCYMMANNEEYWAEGVQAWFHASVRKDVNSGMNTKEHLYEKDPN